METKFQTSFIPKKPLTSEQRTVTARGGTSILMVIAVVIFLASVAGAFFSVFWVNVLTERQKEYKEQLAMVEKRFPIADIENLKKVNNKIDLSKKLLQNHIAVEEIFSIISQLTVQDVRFNNFTFTAPSKDTEGVNITMGGVAKSFYALAYQSDVFGASEQYGSNKVLKNPVISSVSESQENGSISFNFSATVNPSDLLFHKLISSEVETEGSSTTQ